MLPLPRNTCSGRKQLPSKKLKFPETDNVWREMLISPRNSSLPNAGTKTTLEVPDLGDDTRRTRTQGLSGANPAI